MQLNVYTAITKISLFLIVILITTSNVFGQNENDIYDLRIDTEVDCRNNILTAAIQIKSQQDSFRIGTSSILFKYEKEVIEFLDYKSENFDEHDKIVFFGSEASVWDSHKFNSSFAGTCNLTLLAELAAASFPIIEDEWITIGFARFSVKNINASPNFTFDIDNTNFNRHAPNDGTKAPTKGTFYNNNNLLATQCECEPPTLNNDTINFDCPKSTFEANLIINDIVSNPVFEITSNPNNGTATINLNGILSYTSTSTSNTAPFCGIDQLTYQVCNDGDSDCCSEATVYINLSEELPPIFMNPPADMTVTCGNVPEMGPIQALDNCILSRIVQNEMIEDGNCGNNKIYVRTWTAIDACDNQAVHTQKIYVVDDIAPTISCPMESIIDCSTLTDSIIESGQPTVTDNCASLNEIMISFSDEEITEVCENKVQREFRRTWTAQDPCGNMSTCTQLIKIIDDLAPTITCPDNITVNCGQDILPESLEQFATASDNCSEVTIAYEDEGTIPGNCEFETVTINRTWTATDACGNSTSCIQEISITGNPCPEIIENEILVYQCEKETVNLLDLVNMPVNSTIFFVDKNTQEPIADMTQYFLPATGCEIGQFEFSYKIYDERQCLLENSVLIIKTIPKIIVETRLSSDGCKAELILECPELYNITWLTENDNGTGNVFEPSAGDSGIVVFTVRFDSLELSEEHGLSCFMEQFEVAYYCAKPCPIAEEEELTIIGCHGEFINLRDRLQIGESDRYESEETIANLSEYQLVSDSIGCGVSEKLLHFIIYNEDNCPVRSVTLNLKTIQPIQGAIVYENDSCITKLNLSCPNFFQVTWKDYTGNTGEGAIYEGTETSGFVNFYVEPINDLYKEQLCARDSFVADFDCTVECPPSIVADWFIEICGEETIHLPTYFDFDANARFTVNGATIDENNEIKFSNESCQIENKGFEITVFDSNDCVIITHGVGIINFPVVKGNITYESENNFCTPKLSLECADNFQVTWSDGLGNIGNGNSYEATNGTSGVVAFYVKPLIDSLTDFSCPIDTFYADYNCDSLCPETIERTNFLTVCAESTINIFEKFGLNNNRQYLIDDEIVIDGVFKVGNPFGCEMGTKEYDLKAYDDNQCLVEIIKLSIKIIPAIYGEIQISQDVACGVLLQLECYENYIVSWEDTDGNTGTGSNYTAATNTSGTVTFTVEYFTDEIIFSEDELACFSQTFTGQYDCNTFCPDPIFEIEEIYGCEGDVINLFDRLEFTDNFSYKIVDNINEQDLTKIKLENAATDCSISQFSINVEVSDESSCVIKSIFISFTVIPNITGILVDATSDCGLQLDLACPDMYNIRWEDNFGNSGEGTNYFGAEDKQGTVIFSVDLKDTTLYNQLENKSCLAAEFSGNFGCCNPVGTVCDDGKEETFADMEDGACGCVGMPCELENRGTVIDRTGLDACTLLIEMEDGTILEPATLPDGVELAAGQKVVFSFVELVDIVSACQSGKIVQIICLEVNCLEKGTPCTDGDLATINDVEDGKCNCVGETAPEVNGEINLRFRPRLDCENNTYCVVLQAKGQQEDFFIGTSSIMVNYNEDALEFAGYTSTQFDKNTDCTGGNAELWDDHKFDGTSVSGKFCLTMTLNGEGLSCPEITTTEWEDIGILCFDIMNNQTSPQLTFESNNTHFNNAENNDGNSSISLGQLGEVDIDHILVCAQSDMTTASNELALKAMLQGPYKANNELMSDQLRRKGFIPEKEPYTGIPSFNHIGDGGGEQMAAGVMDVAGNNAIVDWVFLELRSGTDSTMVLATRSALIQRDGDVVDVDGVSKVRFNIPDGNYYVCLKHRNHLGVMTKTPLTFESGTPTNLDFTDPATPTYGVNALNENQGTMVLWGGNSNPDGYVILAGGGLGLPDRDMIFFDIFLSLWYSNPETPITYNSVLHGYYGSDTNMDGKVKYQGPKNDIDAIIFFNVLFHPGNTQYRLNYAIFEQIP